MAGTGTTRDRVWGSVSTPAEGRFELEEKYRRWKETHLPAGDACSTFPLDKQLEALGDERLKAAHEAAMAGLTAEKLLAHIKPIGNFHYSAGLTASLLFKRGIYEPELSSKQTSLE